MPMGRRDCQPTGARWRRVRAYVIATQTHCGICGGPVDKRRAYRNPLTGKRDPLSPSVDHRTPVAHGGAPYAVENLQLAHLGCNQDKGARVDDGRRRRQSRDW
ncbi:MAG: HNH endonuclease [Pseudomonadota bacterium]